jgi:hypothetical protein
MTAPRKSIHLMSTQLALSGLTAANRIVESCGEAYGRLLLVAWV